MLRFSRQAFDEVCARGKHLAAEKQAQPASGHPDCERERQPETDAEKSIHQLRGDVRAEHRRDWLL